MSTKHAATKVHGPFECLTLNELGEGQPLLTLPYSDVEGAQLSASITGNSAPGSVSGDSQFWIIIEVGIWGSFQGVPSLLKRVALTPRTGPTSYLFGEAQAYDKVEVRARNMSGGRRGPGLGSVVSLATGFSALLNVTVQPRQGIGFRQER